MDAIEKIFLEAATLSRWDRVALARRLIRAAKDEPPPGLIAEIKRSIEDVKSGRVKTLSMDEVLASLSEELGYEPITDREPIVISHFDQWVSDNNPPSDLEYGGAFWDHVELMRSLINKFDGTDARVVGTYVVDTPPPEEKLTMPAIAFEVRGVTFAVRWDFGACPRWPNEWTVSVKRRSPYLGPTFSLFNEETDLSHQPISGFGPELTLPSFRTSRSAFTCELVDEYDVAMLIRLLSFEA